MRVVIQRVRHASVSIANALHSSIDSGLLVLVGVEDRDGKDDCEWLAKKICSLRIFDDEQGVMNLDLKQTGGNILVVSQFTLHALTKKGNRPSYIRAAKEPVAIPLYKYFISQLESELGKEVKSGVFGADMQVELLNDGPVTILIDSQNRE